MSSPRPGDRPHLDANAGREVVYCHACGFEWYNDEQGLECPRCHGDITEVIDASEDPRDHSQPMPDYPSSASTSPERHMHHHEVDSDPEEADIEEHLGPRGFLYRRSTSAGPGHEHVHDHHHHYHDHNHQHHHHGHQHRHNPGVDPVLQRFTDMLQGFGPPSRVGGQGNFGGNGPTVQRATFTSRTTGGGTASVTIFSGPAPNFRRQAPDTDDPFQAFFNSTMQDMDHGPGAPGNPQHQHGGPPVGFAQSLQDILNLFNPANAAAGDAVYSQEALDRIITQLMEQNPQSNAAPPASDQALQNLDRRPVTAEMLGKDGNIECSICIDDLEEGQTAAFLPCKHWFHEECVVLWLKEHNTCPVCRSPIENRARGNASSSGNGSGGHGSRDPSSNEGQSGSGPSQTHGDPPAPNLNPNPAHGNFGPGTWSAFHSSRYPQINNRTVFYRIGAADPTQMPTRPTLSRPPSQSQTPLNQVMRDISSSQQEQQRNRDREAAPEQSYDTSRFQQRRTSLSPTAPRAYTPAELGARMRQRSPTSSERRRTPDRENSRSSASGAFGWLRDRLGGSQREGRQP